MKEIQTKRPKKSVPDEEEEYIELSCCYSETFWDKRDKHKDSNENNSSENKNIKRKNCYVAEINSCENNSNELCCLCLCSFQDTNIYLKDFTRRHRTETSATGTSW